jgi:tetrahydromethanopterin S-methyltransferase subunit G
MVTTRERSSRLEGAYEQVNLRLDDMKRSIDALRSDINNRFNDVINRINYLYVLFFGGWVTIMVAIIGLYVKG